MIGLDRYFARMGDTGPAQRHPGPSGHPLRLPIDKAAMQAIGGRSCHGS